MFAKGCNLQEEVFTFLWIIYFLVTLGCCDEPLKWNCSRTVPAVFLSLLKDNKSFQWDVSKEVLCFTFYYGRCQTLSSTTVALTVVSLWPVLFLFCSLPLPFIWRKSLMLYLIWKYFSIYLKENVKLLQVQYLNYTITTFKKVSTCSFQAPVL